jgi:hypothetical protein
MSIETVAAGPYVMTTRFVAGVTHDLMVSFSLNNNGRNLLSCSSGSDTMTSLHGLRFLSILWILLGHTYYMKSVSPNINSIVVKRVGNFIRAAELTRSLQ